MSLDFSKTILVSTQVLSKSAKTVADRTSYRFDAIDPYLVCIKLVCPFFFYWKNEITRREIHKWTF